MCTVTFIPQGATGFTLTSNRDEQPARSPQRITVEMLGRQQLAFPRDIQADGTWIATSSADRTVCLLNGAFTQHRRQPPYRRSRGLMVLDYFEYPDTDQFLRGYDFIGMEPFTMIIIDRKELLEFRWDGQQQYARRLDRGEQHIWSSATLYPEEIRQKRRRWFADWLKGRQDFSRESVLDFHFHAGDGDPWNDVIMDRNGVVQTVSITSIVRTGDSIEMYYHDLINDQVKHEKIFLSGEVVGLR